jgi:predicted RNase H-like HicB family nuclease
MDPVRVIYHRDPEGWWAESPEIPGWSAAGSTYEEVRALVDEGLPIALGHGDFVAEHFVPVDAAATG